MKKDFIYLDWNVVKALEEKTCDPLFERIIDALKSQYLVPFSFAHLCDRHKKFSKENIELVKKDLAFFSHLSDGYMLGRCDDDYDISPKSIYQKFDEVTEAQHIQYPMPNIPDDVIQEVKCKGMQKFFSNDKNIKWFIPFMLTALHRFNCNPDLYKMCREIFSINPPKGMEFWSDLKNPNMTEENLRKFVETYLGFNQSNNPCLRFKLQTAYLLLDFNSTYRETKINEKNNFTNMYTDGEHMLNASFAKYYITQDNMARKKATFVYDAYGLQTKVFNIADFIDSFPTFPSHP